MAQDLTGAARTRILQAVCGMPYIGLHAVASTHLHTYLIYAAAYTTQQTRTGLLSMRALPDRAQLPRHRTPNKQYAYTPIHTRQPLHTADSTSGVLTAARAARVESSRLESSRVESSRVESSRVESSRVESGRVQSTAAAH